MKEFEQFCKKLEIVNQNNTPQTPQDNGDVARINQKLMNKARCMLRNERMEKYFWE